MAEGKVIGKVTHYYDKLGVAIIDLSGALKVSDKVKFVKGEDELEQAIESMQIERATVDSAKKGDIIGVKVDEPIKEGAVVHLV